MISTTKQSTEVEREADQPAPSPSGIHQIQIDRIQIDAGTQARAELNEVTINEYCETIQNKVELPPIVVFFDGDNFMLVDGFHRWHGHKRAGRGTITCEVRPGNRRDAILYAVGANTAHGLRRSNSDKRRAVEMMLADGDWWKMSDGWIAEKCGVSQPFVGSIRQQVKTVMGCADEKRLGSDGKQYSLPTKAVAAPVADPAGADDPAESHEREAAAPAAEDHDSGGRSGPPVTNKVTAEVVEIDFNDDESPDLSPKDIDLVWSMIECMRDLRSAISPWARVCPLEERATLGELLRGFAGQAEAGSFGDQ